jgi:hypothetical protein
MLVLLVTEINHLQITWQNMKFLTALGIVVLVAALTMKPKSIEERVQVQLEESEALHDSAMVLLKELHDKNDSLLTQYFGK